MYATSTLPPNGNKISVPEKDLVPLRFVSYDKTGKLISTYNEARYFYFQRLSQGEPIVAGDGDLLTHYVEFVGEARAPVLRVRPELTRGFDKTEMAVREAATLAGLPPATVAFEGPVKGHHSHEGGDLVVGWTVPGTYAVTIEAFPYLPATFTLTVDAAA